MSEWIWRKRDERHRFRAERLLKAAAILFHSSALVPFAEAEIQDEFSLLSIGRCEFSKRLAPPARVLKPCANHFWRASGIACRNDDHPAAAASRPPCAPFAGRESCVTRGMLRFFASGRICRLDVPRCASSPFDYRYNPAGVAERDSHDSNGSKRDRWHGFGHSRD